MASHRRVIIASVPDGPLEPGHFAVQSVPSPDCGEGEVLCRTRAFTIGAGQRAGLQGSASYAGAPVAGVVMGGTGLAVVEASRSPEFRPGDVVVGPTGWDELAAVKASALRRVDGAADASLHLGLYGTNGLTAYFGLQEIARPERGQTVVVSAAAGSVGHIVGQFAKRLGCRVVGVAGSPEKCGILTGELGFDAAVNYKAQDFRDQFRSATPDRIDVYWDNTGGAILESALFRMNTFGRIVCCGAVSAYDGEKPAAGPRGVPGLLVNNQVRMEGFIVYRFADRYDEARKAMAQWVAAGEVRQRTTEYHGIESAPQAFVDLLAGRTIGTTIVRLG
ncbi:MAG TPA: NADP-dependent oxidoreductase [Tepidiformaceae bacterium]|nr:NADP-dependent oxidoreductase [Tepidiformaceae bacterium]